MIHNSYVECDWVGKEDFISPQWGTHGRKPLVPMSLIKRKFDAFSKRVPIARGELAKLVPHISLDHSHSSLEEIDEWLAGFLSEYASNNYLEFPYTKRGKCKADLLVHVDGRSNIFESEQPNLWVVGIFEGLTPTLRSILGDIYVYYGECLQAVFPTLVWEPNIGRERDDRIRFSGFPDLVGENLAFSINRGGLGAFLNNMAFSMITGETRGSLALGYQKKIDEALDYKRRGLSS